MILSSSDYKILLDIAKQSIKHGYLHHAPILLRPTDFSDNLRQKSSTFISIKDGNNYLGCQGNTTNLMPLYFSVSKNAFNSAFRDTRYPPLNNYQAKKCNIRLHHLYSYTDYTNLSLEEMIELVKPDDSIMLTVGNNSAIMLAVMQEHFKTTHRFITETKAKAKIETENFKEIQLRLYKTYVSEETKLGDLNED